MQTIKLDAIRIDGGTQPREEIDLRKVDEYAEAMVDGAEFPALVVFTDGAEYWLADGFHRYHAMQSNDVLSCECEVRQGTIRDAVLYSVGANHAHGLPRTNADKRKAVMTLLRDEEWGKWSDSEIARRCRVDHKTVTGHRLSLGNFPSEPRTYTTKHGTVTTMNTENIGKSRQREDTQKREPMVYTPPCVGKAIAQQAIRVMEQIAQDDSERAEGFRMMREWLEVNNG